MSDRSHASIVSHESTLVHSAAPSSPTISAALLPEEDLWALPAERHLQPPTFQQEHLDLWRGDRVPRPSSTEVRLYIRNAGNLLQQLLWFADEASQALNEVSVKLANCSASLIFVDECGVASRTRESSNARESHWRPGGSSKQLGAGCGMGRIKGEW